MLFFDIGVCLICLLWGDGGLHPSNTARVLINAKQTNRCEDMITGKEERGGCVWGGGGCVR